MMKDVVLIEVRTVTLSAVGETVTWSPSGTKRHCEIVPSVHPRGLRINR